MTIDCIAANLVEVLPTVLSVPVDVALFDPPYAPRVHARAVSNNNAAQGPGIHKRDLGFAPLSPELLNAVAACFGHAKRWSAVFSDLESGHVWRDAVSGPGFVRTVPWVRWSQPQKSGDRPPSGAELITIWHPKGAKHWNGRGDLTAFETEALVPDAVLRAKSLRGADKYSCEKPLDLMLSLVSWFSDPGELVLDGTCGVGTTGQACRLLDRDALLIDLDEAAVAEAERRCAAPLSARDKERAARWVAEQEAWPKPSSPAGEARAARAAEDTARVRAWL